MGLLSIEMIDGEEQLCLLIPYEHKSKKTDLNILEDIKWLNRLKLRNYCLFMLH